MHQMYKIFTLNYTIIELIKVFFCNFKSWLIVLQQWSVFVVGVITVFTHVNTLNKGNFRNTKMSREFKFTI